MKVLKAETIVSKLANAVIARNDARLAEGTKPESEFKKIRDLYLPEGQNYRSFVNAVESVRGAVDFDMMIKIIQKHKPAGANDSTYMQAKVIEKINKLIFALAQGNFKQADTHSRSLMVNALLNGKLCARAAFATLCKVNWSEEITETLKERNNYTSGTGSTQLSSTKELMRILKLSDSVKGTRNADFTFNETGRALILERFEEVAKLVNRADAIDTEETEETADSDE